MLPPSGVCRLLLALKANSVAFPVEEGKKTQPFKLGLQSIPMTRNKKGASTLVPNVSFFKKKLAV